MSTIAIEFALNGSKRTASVPASQLLIDYLRDTLDIKGARIGCSRGACGACTVLIDGTPVAACSSFAFQIDGKSVETIEGLESNGAMHVIQQAFIDHAAFQCGYCTSGMILLTKAMIAHETRPDRGTIVDWVSSNICRCSGYPQIIAAIEDAVSRTANAGAGEKPAAGIGAES
jgi:aerobic carbon-monoxide dehydrogenase small subunit